MGAVFITGTGTDIGKSFVTAGLIRELRRQGRAADALKPVASGFDIDTAEESDAGILLRAMEREITAEMIAQISPWRFKAPLSPDMAARLEGLTIDFEALLTFTNDKIQAAQDILLIEGVGGIMVPLDDRHTVLDWMTALNLPVLLVAGSYLGAISHTLSAADILVRRGLDVISIVVNETVGSSVGLEDTASAVRRFTQSIEVVTQPRLRGDIDRPATFEYLANLI